MLATEMFSGKPDAGNPPVRFEEGEDDQHRAGLFPTRLHNFVLVVEPLLSPLSSPPTASNLKPSAARRPVMKYAGALMHHAQNHPDAIPRAPAE